MDDTDVGTPPKKRDPCASAGLGRLNSEPTIFAWVAHIECCDGPAADSPGQMFDA